MKKILLSILLALFLTFIAVTPIFASLLYAVIYNNDDTETDAIANGLGQTFTPGETVEVSGFMIWTKSSVSNTGDNVRGVLADWDGSNISTSPVLAEKTVAWSLLPPDAPGYLTILFDNPVTIPSGDKSAIWIEGLPDADDYFHVYMDTDDSFAAGALILWTGVEDIHDFKFKILSEFQLSPHVVTSDPLYKNNAVTLGGIMTSIGNEKRFAAYIEYGFDTSYGMPEFIGYLNPENLFHSFSKEFSGIPPETTFHYRAYIVDDDDNRYNGEDKTFYVGALSNPITHIELTSNDIDGETFDISLETLGGAPSVNMTLYYGTTVAELTSETDWDIVGYNIDELVTRKTFTPGAPFAAGDVYYVRVFTVHSDNEGYSDYSEIITFAPFDPAKPLPVNIIEQLWQDWFGGDYGVLGSMVWWIIGAVMIGSGLLTDLSYRHNPPWVLILASIGTALMLIIVDTSNLWIIALLAIIAGLLVWWKCK